MPDGPTHETPPLTPPVLTGAGERACRIAENEPGPAYVPFTPAGTVKVRYSWGEKLKPLLFPVEDK